MGPGEPERQMRAGHPKALFFATAGRREGALPASARTRSRARAQIRAAISIRAPRRGNPMDLANHQFQLAARPVGLPKATDWNYAESPVAEPGDDEVLIKILYLSLDPAMRGWMNDGRSYIAPVAIGEVMRSLAAGQVVASNHPGLAVGDYVTGLLGVQEYAIANGNAVIKVDPELAP